MSVTRASFPIVSRVQTGLSAMPTSSTLPSAHPSTGKSKLLDQLRGALPLKPETGAGPAERQIDVIKRVIYNFITPATKYSNA